MIDFLFLKAAINTRPNVAAIYNPYFKTYDCKPMWLDYSLKKIIKAICVFKTKHVFNYSLVPPLKYCTVLILSPFLKIP